MSWIEGARARTRLLFGRGAAESRMNREIGFHLDMETDRLMREQKLDAGEARRRALIAFGGVDKHKEDLRDGRGFAWLGGLSLDFKLGGRMLVKYPGLTVIAVLAMAFGIWFGAVTFEMLSIVMNPRLPFPESDRIVTILNWDLKDFELEERSVHDFQRWRSSARSITDLGAYRDVNVTIVGADSAGYPAVGAEITASAFNLTSDRPMFGRALNVADERQGAPPVVVIGYELWRDRFGADPNVIGRTVRVGATYPTVVGVMPKGFGFPVAHNLWMPFRSDAAVAPRSGPSITVFGKLAPGATFESAQAELTSIGRVAAAELPATHAQLEPRVVPYGQNDPNPNDQLPFVLLIYAFIVVLLIVVCSTVALLLFARAASRETEIVVRSALGATRRRIVTQLFAEALVLGGLAVVVALAMAQVALNNLGRPYIEANYDQVPFWYEFNLSPTTVLVAFGLAVLGAVIAGVIPARKITRGLGTQLRTGTAGGGGVKFGGVWTAVIITQVALTVAIPTVVLLERSEIKRVQSYDMGFAAERYLGVSVKMEPSEAEVGDTSAISAARARFSGVLASLRQRLESEPGVNGVTFVDQYPSDHHVYRRVELVSRGDEVRHLVATATIDPSYFDVLQQPPQSGRAFAEVDQRPDARVAIVDQAFVELVMRGRNPIGQSIRVGTRMQFDSAAAQLPIYEIVGVVKELGMSTRSAPGRDPGVYFPMVPGTRDAMQMLVHTRGEPLSVVPRLRAIATTLDPTIRIGTPVRLDRLDDPLLWFIGLWMKITIGLSAIALLLSLAGIYAVLSYIVARRTREIGVRVALGASARRIITSTFRRPLLQVTAGVAVGGLIVAVMSVVVKNTTQFQGAGSPGLSLGDIALLIVYAVMMLGVCMLACVVPTLRALRVQPTEALRAE